MANEHFHAACLNLEHALLGHEFRHQERLAAAEQRFHDAQLELEQIDQAIKEVFQRPS
jgi:hypothetical protein